MKFLVNHVSAGEEVLKTAKENVSIADGKHSMSDV